MFFLDKNYLLEGETAQRLYQSIKNLPIIDAHNHTDVNEIIANEGWNDIWELEAATDHYVWELMRKRGIPEEKITGKASNKEKWLELAKIFPELAGNPTYEWIHLDLKRGLGIEEPISQHTAEIIWEKSKRILAEDHMQPQNLLKEMNIEIMCTTDEIFSILEGHKKAKEEIAGIKILPTWRTDKIMEIEAEEWVAYVHILGTNYEQSISDLDGFLEALKKSHNYFAEMGCVSSDHGLVEPVSYQVDKARAAEIYNFALNGKELNKEEIRDFKAFILVEFGKLNQESNWVTQFHIGAISNYRSSLLENYGLDSGGDVSNNQIEIVRNLKYFVNYFDQELDIVLYIMEPAHWFTIATISRAFPNVFLGAAWWFADSPFGIGQQLKQVSTVDLFYNYAGMVTDSRKLLSYSSRTEMFRRTLANVVSHQVDRGQLPYNVASDLVAQVSYYGPYKLFFNRK